MPTASEPAAAISPRPSAPVLGVRSATKPIMVGQTMAMPIAKTSAVVTVCAGVTAKLRPSRPRPATPVETISTTGGETRARMAWALARVTAITPLTITSTRMPGRPPACSTAGIQRLGPSSRLMVMLISARNIHSSGEVATALKASDSFCPAAAASVGGNFSRRKTRP